jgi:dTDP-4-dehydrorhamnose 3,5-epimerase
VPIICPSERIDGVVVVEPDVHSDPRGRFVETYRREWFANGAEMVQANRSEKLAGSLAGLHYHRFQTDYFYALRGRARFGLCDLRRGSSTEGATLVIELTGDEDGGLLVPPGVAHGFLAVTDVLVTYLVDHYYDSEDELGVAWDDPEIGIEWGIADPVLSARDGANPRRAAIPTELLPLAPPASAH